MSAPERMRAYLTARRHNGYRGDLIHRVWSKTASVELTEADLDNVLRDNEAQREFIGRCYRDRAQVVALLAAVFPSCWDYTDPDHPRYPVVYIDTPEGQCGWHIDPGDWHLFAHVRHEPGVVWDRHSTEEKYERIQRLCANYLYLLQYRATAQFTDAAHG
jgi:hypothetical protein